jgi:hypothetical protein
MCGKASGSPRRVKAEAHSVISSLTRSKEEEDRFGRESEGARDEDTDAMNGNVKIETRKN